MGKAVFGDCCPDLKKAMTTPPASTFRVEENGVLYLSVGYVQTTEGVGWFDHAVLYCPFCGRKLQDRDAIGRSSK